MFSEIIGETPVNLLNSTLLAVLPTWGPIYEFSFEFRLNCELVPLCEIMDFNKGLKWGMRYRSLSRGGITWNHINVFNLLRDTIQKKLADLSIVPI